MAATRKPTPTVNYTGQRVVWLACGVVAIFFGCFMLYQVAKTGPRPYPDAGK